MTTIIAGINYNCRSSQEGLPAELNKDYEIRDYFGLDMYGQCWINSKKATFPEIKEHGKGMVSDMDSYVKIKQYLYSECAFEKELVGQWAVQ